MPASAPVAESSRVSAITWRSYCSQSQRLEAMSGEAISFSTASAQSTGAGTVARVEAGRRRGLRPRPVIERRVLGQRRQRQVADHLAAVTQDQMAGIGGGADHRRIQAPLVEDPPRRPPRDRA